MNVPEKFSIVGYWHPKVVMWHRPWHEATRYILLDVASVSVQSYWVKPLKPMSRSGLRKVRRRLEYGDNVLVTQEEYEARWNAEVLRLEQEKMWKVLNTK
jgi:hypothetical protein